MAAFLWGCAGGGGGAVPWQGPARDIFQQSEELRSSMCLGRGDTRAASVSTQLLLPAWGREWGRRHEL